MQNNSPGTLSKFFGHTISFVTHPLFVPTYFILYLIKVVPFEFVGITDWQLQLRVFSVFWLTAFFPQFVQKHNYRIFVVQSQSHFKTSDIVFCFDSVAY